MKKEADKKESDEVIDLADDILQAMDGYNGAVCMAALEFAVGKVISDCLKDDATFEEAMTLHATKVRQITQRLRAQERRLDA